MEDIFDLSLSKKEKEFVKTGLDLELDVATDVVETFADIPYIGSLIKLGRIGNKFRDLHFVRKLARFLEKEQEIPEVEKKKFIDSLDAKKRQKMYEYLIHYLLNAEDDVKADIMGFVYRERVYGRISDDMFLRLCSAVNKLFVGDLKYLDLYLKPNAKSNYVTNNLYSSGLLNVTGSSVQGDTLNIGGQYILNDIGKLLYDILVRGYGQSWFVDNRIEI